MINAKTQIAAVIGNPIEHSLSPLIHNTGIQSLGLNFVYTAFKVTDVAAAISAMRELNFVGYSVTIPHKVEVMKYLDEIDAQAKAIGAVNTVVNRSGRLFGYNSDCLGAMDALKKVTVLKGKKVYVLGAGGAARAIVAGLLFEKAEVIIFNRTFDHAKELAEEFDCGCAEWSELDSNCDVIINCTSVGMFPKVDATPLDEKLLEKKMVVFDIVYNPLETKLIKAAKARGCKAVEGVEMFLGQAYVQFEMFFDKPAPRELMRKVLLEELVRIRQK